MTTARRGLFVAFEGPEGAGKSTQIGMLAERLRSSARQVLVTREPGGTRAGDALRQVLLDPQQLIFPLSEFLIYSASRAQLVSEVIEPELGAGKDVLSDRYAGASVAYQGYGRGLDLELVGYVSAKATGGLTPDLTVLLDIEPEEGLSRARSRSASDRLESAGLDFHRRVREGYLRQAASDNTWLVIDAALPPAAVSEQVWRGVEPLLRSPGVAHRG